MKEKLHQLYVVEELSVEEIAKTLQISGQTVRRKLRSWEIKRDPAISQRFRVEAQNRTYKEKYGGHFTKTEEYRNKSKKTCLEKYGVENAAQSKEVKEKVAKNNLEKYGETNPLKVPAIKEKVRLEMIEKRGYAYPFQVGIKKEVIEIITIKENFEKYLLENPNLTIDEISTRLNYHRTAILRYLKVFDLLYLVDYRPSHSSAEREINEMFGNLFYSDRQVLKPLEIDLYNEEMKLGIEFNGNYWHSIDNKGSSYHKNKSLLAIDKGVRLIHIFEYEWEDPIKRKKIESLISNIVSDKRKTVYARQCTIKEISSTVSREFLSLYHLQGADRCSIRVGLFYEDKLVGVMTFSKPRFNNKFEWEISRLCWHSDYKVVGGANRLFKYFVNRINPNSIISYCDIAKFMGDVYSSLGFELDHYSRPNYVWCNSEGDIRTRYQCQKHKLIEEFPEFKGQTEDQIMYQRDYWKIEDSGNAVYVWYDGSDKITQKITPTK